jgi:salicylate hydroxylase
MFFARSTPTRVSFIFDLSPFVDRNSHNSSLALDAVEWGGVHPIAFTKREWLAAHEGWHPQVRGIIGSADETFIWALFDRRPMARWSVGRVTLLGDACHAMLPFMARSSSDRGRGYAGDVLVAHHGSGLAQRIARYEAFRLPRASRVQGLSETNKMRFHLRDGPAQQARDAEMARGTTDFSPKAVAWLYGYDARSPEGSPIQ